MSLGQSLIGCAHAVIDISDGLMADLEHICTASGVAAKIETRLVPLSEATAAFLADTPDLFENVMTGGDDYELLIIGNAHTIESAAQRVGTRVTQIGKITDGSGVSAYDTDGSKVLFGQCGWRHE
jgi:thiamine-monophosphate kinase